MTTKKNSAREPRVLEVWLLLLAAWTLAATCALYVAEAPLRAEWIAAVLKMTRADWIALVLAPVHIECIALMLAPLRAKWTALDVSITIDWMAVAVALQLLIVITVMLVAAMWLLLVVVTLMQRGKAACDKPVRLASLTGTNSAQTFQGIPAVLLTSDPTETSTDVVLRLILSLVVRRNALPTDLTVESALARLRAAADDIVWQARPASIDDTKSGAFAWTRAERMRCAVVERDQASAIGNVESTTFGSMQLDNDRKMIEYDHLVHELLRAFADCYGPRVVFSDDLLMVASLILRFSDFNLDMAFIGLSAFYQVFTTHVAEALSSAIVA